MNSLEIRPSYIRLDKKLYFAAKRIMDLLISAIALLSFIPILLVSIILIKIEDGGPCFYSQIRIGKNGKPFKFYKLRTMSVQADEDRSEVIKGFYGVRFKDKNDPRITKTGRVLRRYSMDEMPQLWNVFKGDMTLVGPRPPIPEEVEMYNRRQYDRLKVQQGITCYWQVKGRSLIPFEQQIEMDLDYIQRMSFMEDIKILIMTIPAVISGRGAF